MKKLGDALNKRERYSKNPIPRINQLKGKYTENPGPQLERQKQQYT